jgi:hypothetical protein
VLYLREANTTRSVPSWGIDVNSIEAAAVPRVLDSIRVIADIVKP